MQRRDRVFGSQQQQHFLLHPLHRQGVEPVRPACAGGQRLFIGVIVAEAGVKTEIAQDAQAVFAQAILRLANKADMPPGQIGDAADRVHQFPVRIKIQRIERKIAPGRVQFPVMGEGHLRMAAMGNHIHAEGGNFEPSVTADGRDRAMIQPGRNGGDPGPFQPLQHRAGRQVNGDVDIFRLETKEGIAHTAADKPRPPAFTHQGFEHRHRFRPASPGRRTGRNINKRSARAHHPLILSVRQADQRAEPGNQ